MDLILVLEHSFFGLIFTLLQSSRVASSRVFARGDFWFLRGGVCVCSIFCSLGSQDSNTETEMECVMIPENI